MVDTPEKEALVQGTAETTTGAGVDGLEAIFREHRERVFRAAYRVTGNASDAEDVLQTVFLRLARREGGSPLSDSLGGYLHRAAVNAGLDVIRSRQVRKTTPLDDVAPVLPDTGDDGPAQAQAAGETVGLIRQALTKLSPKAAEMFSLRYFEGYGNHEIAGMLGASRSTVNVILHRSREKVKEELRQHVGEGR